MKIKIDKNAFELLRYIIYCNSCGNLAVARQLNQRYCYSGCRKKKEKELKKFLNSNIREVQ